MTTKQSFAIYLKTGYDVRGLNLSNEEVSKLFELSVSDAIEVVKSLGGIFKKEVSTEEKPKQSFKEFEQIIAEAREAGLDAVNEMIQKKQIVPMIVTQHSNMLDDNSPVKKEWYVADGVCGFAWINVRPATSRFAKWLKSQNIGSTDSYYGGITIWISEFGQSMQKKETYARAYAEVLRKHGFKAHMMSRMD